MTLGEKLYQRRTELGLSQSEVADSQITRNMLSRLEHDQASPSVRTLEHLANKLDVSMSWLLEDGPMCVDSSWTEQVRNLFLQGEYAAVLQLDTNAPLSEEGKLLLVRSTHQFAVSCLKNGKLSQARAALEKIQSLQGGYLTGYDELQTKRFLAECSLADGESRNASVDDYLACECVDLELQNRILVEAENDLLNGNWSEAQVRLDLLTDDASARMIYLRGRMMLQNGDKKQAVSLLEQALWDDEDLGYRKVEIYRLLEQYYREQEDYKLAYHYASLRMTFLEK